MSRSSPSCAVPWAARQRERPRTESRQSTSAHGMIRLAMRVRGEQAEIVLAELLELVPAGVEERRLSAEVTEYAVYGAPGELPSLPDLNALAGDALVEISTS